MKKMWVMLSAGVMVASLFASSVAIDYRGYVGASWRQYDGQGAQGQDASDFSLVAEPELAFDWNDGSDRWVSSFFLRADSMDDERTHFDVRESYWLHIGDGWELRVGADIVFWGVTESQHLVDIINQTDGVEGADGEDKLGQPMVAWSTEQDWGLLSLYWLPYFRERNFPGIDGRLRPFVPVADDAVYESSAEEWHQDFAARWFKTIGDADIAVSLFRGTDRFPDFVIDAGPQIGIRLVPYYRQMTQLGFEGQYMSGDTAWKMEAVWRDRADETYFASVLGLEHTLYGIFGSDKDLGILLEYHYDERRDKRLNPFDNDTFIGARLAFNDEDSSEILGGFIIDNDNQGWMFFAETSRRLTSHWKISIEARLFADYPQSDIVAQYQQDDHIEVELRYYY